MEGQKVLSQGNTDRYRDPHKINRVSRPGSDRKTETKNVQGPTSPRSFEQLAIDESGRVFWGESTIHTNYDTSPQPVREVQPTNPSTRVLGHKTALKKDTTHNLLCSARLVGGHLNEPP